MGGQEETLGWAVEALTTDEVVASGGATPSMPCGENICLVLTLQREPVSGLTYAAGLLRFAWPPKFRMPMPDEFSAPVLSRLAFVTRHESVMSYLSTRNARTLTRLERERAGTTIPIVAAGGSVFVTTSPEIEQLVGQCRPGHHCAHVAALPSWAKDSSEGPCPQGDQNAENGGIALHAASWTRSTTSSTTSLLLCGALRAPGRHTS